MNRPLDPAGRLRTAPGFAIVAATNLARRIPDALSDIVKESRADGLADTILDKMLDGISARCTTVAEAYDRALPTP